jgi:hypothetical protein
MKGVAPNISSTLATGRQAERQDERDEAPGQQRCAQQQRGAGIANVDQYAAPLPENEWQHRGNEERRAPKGDIPGRQADAAHDYTRRAENDGGANRIDDAQHGGTL